MDILNFESVIPEGQYKDMTVQEAFDKNKKSIFSMIKKNRLLFSDDVLKAANITRIIREHNAYYDFERHEVGKQKKLKKDTKSIEQILDEIEMDRDGNKDFYKEPIETEIENNIG